MATNTTPQPGDDRIKAFCLRHGFLVPTDQEMKYFPEELRKSPGETWQERYEAGLALWNFLMTGKYKPRGPAK